MSGNLNRSSRSTAQRLMVVPIIARHNGDLELNRLDFVGAVRLAELRGLVEFVTAEPHWLTFDCLNVVNPGAEFVDIALTELDAVFARYRDIFAPMDVLIMRRAAWLCESPAALRHIRYWLQGRDAKKHLMSDIRLFDGYADAGDWLLLQAGEAQLLERRQGFAEIARFEAAAPEFGR